MLSWVRAWPVETTCRNTCNLELTGFQKKDFCLTASIPHFYRNCFFKLRKQFYDLRLRGLPVLEKENIKRLRWNQMKWNTWRLNYWRGNRGILVLYVHPASKVISHKATCRERTRSRDESWTQDSANLHCIGDEWKWRKKRIRIRTSADHNCI